MTFLATPSAKKLKQAMREINATVPPTPKYLKYAKTPITWDQSDHPGNILTPGAHALIVSHVVMNHRLRRVLMDGGVSINIMYLSTLEKLHLSQTQLRHSNIRFHGIVPGRQATSLGEISLDVTFGTPDHFRTEKVLFEVVTFESVYHAILGRLTFAKFMARSCYIYNKLKMPGPNGGVITIQGDFALAQELELGNALCAERIIANEELKELTK